MVARPLDLEFERAIAMCVQLTAKPKRGCAVESARVSWIATGGGLRASYRCGTCVDLGWWRRT